MRHHLPVATTLIAAIALAGASACTPLRSHQGYIIDADLVNSVRPGIDNRQSVLATLGTPTFAAQFNQGDWYYVARDARNFAFNSPRVRDQLIMQISFDPAGNVAAIRKSGKEQIVSVGPYGKTTPTLGRKRGFFQDLFGNIGAVGAAPGGGGGGGRDQP